ncbi:MAG: site-specific DNA-methyltransferase [Elusimicrobiota bacterium]|nr:site-specific DNA-methyltransferase [Elusimicrobiota bacterium]
MLTEIQDELGTNFDPNSFLELAQKKLKKMNLAIWTNKYLLLEYLQFARQNNYNKEIVLWLKPNAIPLCGTRYKSDKEYCMVIKEKGATFNSGLRHSLYGTYWIEDINHKTTLHPTEKPLQIFKKLILVHTKENDTVLDMFCGSGTTGIACIEWKRNYILIEKNEKYYEMAKKRLEAEKRQLKLEI